jgi:uncharacterized protein
MNNKFVFDTNTLISAFIFANSIPKKAYNLAKSIGIIFVSKITFAELQEAFLRTIFEKYIKIADREAAIEEYRFVVKFAYPSITLLDCLDPKDNKFLELAVECNANCIISGDDDLLELHPYQNIPILNPSDFIEQFSTPNHPKI